MMLSCVTFPLSHELRCVWFQRGENTSLNDVLCVNICQFPLLLHTTPHSKRATYSKAMRMEYTPDPGEKKQERRLAGIFCCSWKCFRKARGTLKMASKLMKTLDVRASIPKWYYEYKGTHVHVQKSTVTSSHNK